MLPTNLFKKSFYIKILVHFSSWTLLSLYLLLICTQLYLWYGRRLIKLCRLLTYNYASRFCHSKLAHVNKPPSHIMWSLSEPLHHNWKVLLGFFPWQNWLLGRWRPQARHICKTSHEFFSILRLRSTLRFWNACVSYQNTVVALFFKKFYLDSMSYLSRVTNTNLLVVIWSIRRALMY